VATVGFGPVFDYKRTVNTEALGAGGREFAPDGETATRYKYAFDLAVIAVAAIVLLPFWLTALVVIPIAIWLDDRGPVFFSQDRVGLHGRTFRMLKLRTMKIDAGNEELARENDCRITRVGALLRKFHLDEAPQVVNVLRGEMSLVGPRAESVVRHNAIVQKLPRFKQRLRVKPGIAGLAQVRGSYWASPSDKLRYDNLYIRHVGPLQDLKLLFSAVYTVLHRAYAPPPPPPPFSNNIR